jgi:hypothetical protein
LANAYAAVRAASAFLSTLLGVPAEDSPGKDREAPPAPLSVAPPSPAVENRCPVCQARFRGVPICSRCGANLEPLMLLSAEAWQLRQAARQALAAGNVERALRLSTNAQGIQHTSSGDALRMLSAWLKTDTWGRP